MKPSGCMDSYQFCCTKGGRSMEFSRRVPGPSHEVCPINHQYSLEVQMLGSTELTIGPCIVTGPQSQELSNMQQASKMKKAGYIESPLHYHFR